MRRARRQAVWRKPWVRAVLTCCVLVLTALLVAQVGWHERNRLAAMWPALKPVLVTVCERLGCSIEPFEQIESVNIAHTELVRAKDGDYRFTIGLRNRAAWPVATPAVELTLTNREGEPVASRVILISDWGEPMVELAPDNETTLTLRLALRQPDELRMDGFRAVVFYP